MPTETWRTITDLTWRIKHLAWDVKKGQLDPVKFMDEVKTYIYDVDAFKALDATDQEWIRGYAAAIGETWIMERIIMRESTGA